MESWYFTIPTFYLVYSLKLAVALFSSNLSKSAIRKYLKLAILLIKKSSANKLLLESNIRFIKIYLLLWYLATPEKLLFEIFS